LDSARLDEPLALPAPPGHADPAVGDPGETPVYVWVPRPKFQDRVWLHVLLLLLTIATTTLIGSLHYLEFQSNFQPMALPPIDTGLLARGLWYSVTILAILGCHELGHYLACRYYDVDASLPFFIPVPPPSWAIWGSTPAGYSLNLHPMAFAAWFGLLATALNLFPIGQLDGGHISYAVLGRRSTLVTFVMMGVAVVLSYFSPSWIVWTLLLAGMLFFFGARHPRTPDERIPLDRTRVLLAIFALVMFVLCFTPVPIEPMQLLQH
jgi:hypothetical protein